MGFLWLLPAAAARAEPDPLDILSRSIEKETKATYQGRQETTVTGPRGATQRTEQNVKHKGPRKLRIEYLFPPRLNGNFIIDDGTDTWHYLRRPNVVERSKSRVREAPRLDLLRTRVRRGLVRVEYLGEAIIAGRPTYGVAITAVQPPRRREIWLDQDNGVVLKAHDSFPDRRVSEAVFSSIQFNVPLQDSDFVWTPQPGVAPVEKEGGRPIPVPPKPPRGGKVQIPNWGPLLLPKLPGYELHGSRMLRLAGQPVIHLRFTGSGGSFSLFESLAQRPLLNRPGRMKRENYFLFQRGRVNLLIVGALPLAELQRIADSVQ